MNNVLRSLSLCAALGLIVAGLAWFIWRSAGGLIADDWSALWLTLVVGVLAACGAGSVATWLRTGRPEAETNRQSVKKPQRTPAKRKRVRRHPLIGDALGYIRPTLRWEAASRSLCRLLRLPKARLVGKTLVQVLHPEDIAAVERAFSLASSSNRVERAFCRFAIADSEAASPSGSGAFLVVRLDIWAKKSRSGELRRFVCQVIDLTSFMLEKESESQSTRRDLAHARKNWQQVQRSLTRLKFSYRDLYQNAPVMYFSLDNAGRLVTFNDTLIHTLGYKRTELHGKTYSVLLAPETLKSYVTIAESTPLAEGERETQWRLKDGAVIDIWLHTVPVHDERGKFVRYRSAALDLTEKNRLAHELRARGDELERTNQRLRTINSELEAFTHVVSHDLKEPLRTLQAYSHILAEEHGSQLGPDGFQYINHLIRASRRLGLLIDELLNLSQAGRIAREPRVFNLLEVVATVRQDLVDLIQRKQAVILTEGSLPDVVGDTVRITQLMTNLVGNGLKYNTNPSPQVIISAAVSSDDPARITVAVRDNGIGIDAAYHQQIFAIFRRLHQGDEFEGTGAGLAICKKIVEGHGGSIWVESKLGEGATFFFTLPRYVPSKSVDSSAGAKRSGGDAPPAKARVTAVHRSTGEASSPRIVLVEDQPEVAMIIQKLGKRDGLAITWFATAEDAWEHLRENNADLLLLDVNLPGMNGVELCQHLRRLEHLRDVPVAMFTPDHDPERLDEYRQAGADFFLTKDLLCKPVDWQRKILELVQQIRQPLAR